MGINDVLSDLLIGVGLKKSEKRKIENAIDNHEERIRGFNDKLAAHVREIQEIETRIRRIKEKYDAAHGAVKATYEAQLRSLLKECQHTKELRDLIIRNLDKEKLLLRNRRFELENLLNPTNIDEIDLLVDEKRRRLADLKEEDRVADKLEGVEFAPPETEADVEKTLESSDQKDAAFEREINELLGTDSGDTSAAIEETPFVKEETLEEA